MFDKKTTAPAPEKIKHKNLYRRLEHQPEQNLFNHNLGFFGNRKKEYFVAMEVSYDTLLSRRKFEAVEDNPDYIRDLVRYGNETTGDALVVAMTSQNIARDYLRSHNVSDADIAAFETKYDHITRSWKPFQTQQEYDEYVASSLEKNSDLLINTPGDTWLIFSLNKDELGDHGLKTGKDALILVDVMKKMTAAQLASFTFYDSETSRKSALGFFKKYKECLVLTDLVREARPGVPVTIQL